MSENIPFVDLGTQVQSIKPEIMNAVEQVLDSCAFVRGKFVAEFEENYLKLCEANFGAGSNSGTSALSVALEALGVGKGDEVITSTHTFIATAEAICHVGATPVFVDILEDTYNLDPSQIESKITERTKAIIPVHIYGNPCEIDKVAEIAKKHNLVVLEDCAQAHLATYKGKMIGNFGDAAAFSFYPGKNLGAYGDAGFMFFKNEKHVETANQLMDHGRLDKYKHKYVGYNQRMSGIQGAILNVKLKYIEQWTEQRRENAKIYDSILKPKGVKVIQATAESNPVYHLYIIESDQRDKLAEHLNSQGIACGVHYPIPLHLQPAFSYLNYKKGEFPVAEKIADRILSIPIFPELKKEQIERVSEEVLSHI